MSKKTITSVLLAAFIVVLGGWLVVRFGDGEVPGQNDYFPTNPQKFSAEPTIEVGEGGWTTYTDGKLGFSLRYPSNWFYEHNPEWLFFSPLAPDDIKRSSDAGVLLSVHIDLASSQDFSDTKSQATSESAVQAVNTTGTVLVVPDVFTGGTKRFYFFPMNTDQYLRVRIFDDIDPEKYPFEEIVKTLKTEN